jgi:hypothetical protein
MTGGSLAARPLEGYVASVRRLVAISALVGLLTSPVVARTRLFCKYTGVEITDCSEQDVPASPVVTFAGCCEHRLFLPLPASKVSADSFTALVPILVVHSPAPLPPVTPLFRVSWTAPSAGAGPPLFVQHRALLI